MEDAADDAEENNNKKKVDEQLLVNLFFCHSQDDMPLKFFLYVSSLKMSRCFPPPCFFNKRRHFSFFDNTNLKKKIGEGEFITIKFITGNRPLHLGI